MSALLVANRGEVAVRILRAAHDLGLTTVAVASEDEADALHVRSADRVERLGGVGARAYLDRDQVVRAARAADATLVHPGYGYLSEDAELARRLAAAGVAFVGPSPDVLELLGDKVRARALAVEAGVPVVAGTDGAVTVDEAIAFCRSLSAPAPVVLKALAGGGGRGMRVVMSDDDIEAAHQRCSSEAAAAFGNGALYVEAFVPRARHVEIQVVGDGSGTVVALGDRDCSLQRRNQKLVEFAPSPWLPPAMRERLVEAALAIVAPTSYAGLGTVEFLVSEGLEAGFAFMEVNPRLQVEHTVTEEVLGVDLVQMQIRIARGASLDEVGAIDAASARPVGRAVQLRVNAERVDANGTVRPSEGVVGELQVPLGTGVRVDLGIDVGSQIGIHYDSLLAKVVVHERQGDHAQLIRKARRVLAETGIGGVHANVDLLRALIGHPAVATGEVSTTFVDDHLADLVVSPDGAERADPSPGTLDDVAGEHGLAMRSPVTGVVVSVVEPGSAVTSGGELVVVESMKMEHCLVAGRDGTVSVTTVSPGDHVSEGDVLVVIEEHADEYDQGTADHHDSVDLVDERLDEARDRHRLLRDEARPAAVERRHRSGHRTLRENIAALVVDGSFVEYGGLVLPAQRRRHSDEVLRERGPADGVVVGTGEIALGEGTTRRCAVVGYDYTILAGTQGHQGHRKAERMFRLAAEHRLPVVLFAEGGGGRAGETDGLNAFGLDMMTFRCFAALSGQVPLIGLVLGPSFAGNAALAGCCDVIIATADSNLGMGGPVMISGAGLGEYAPHEVGPVEMQSRVGVVDVVVPDDAAAVEVARRYLAYFERSSGGFEVADQEPLRRAVPESSRRTYDVRGVLDVMADAGTVLELRREFGRPLVTALARLEGSPLGIIASDPAQMAGAITSDASDKAARFMQLCDAFGLPILFLCDTPGIMVGPAAESEATVRHSSRLFVVAAHLRVPVFSMVLRRAFGLGAQAMFAGSVHAPVFTVAWPTGEFGSMGLEGMVRLGYRNELDALTGDDRERRFAELLDQQRVKSRAVNAATFFELDDVIDPAASREWIAAGLATVSARPPAPSGSRFIDPW